MKLTAVESSNIAAIDFLEDDRVLLVRYKDGALYAYTGWNYAAFQGIMQSPSKGRALRARCPGPGILITKGGNYAGDPPKSDAISEPDKPTGTALDGGAVAGAAAPLNVLDENADPCCKRSFAALGNLNAFNYFKIGAAFKCGTCGMEFTSAMVGALRQWRIKTCFGVFRR
jgi:KTSC domain